MKYFFLAALVLDFIVADAQETVKNNFVLTGRIIGQDTGMIRLVYPDINGKFMRDTTYLKKGEFSFEGFVSEPTFATLYGNIKSRSVSDPNRTDLFLEPGKMKMELKVNEFKNNKLIGSGTDAELKEFQRFSDEVDKTSINKKDRMNACYNFIKEHPKSYVGPTQMWPYLSFYPYDSIKTLFRSLDLTVQNSIYGRQLARELSKADSSNIGSEAKNFALIDVNGKELVLSDFKGQYVLLDFWASWCVPCRKANPEIKALYQKFHANGLEIISVTYDEDKNAWKKAIQKDNIGMWYHVPVKDFEPSRKEGGNNLDIIEKFAVPSIPFLILIDKSGIIIGRYGSDSKDHLELKRKLKEVFSS